MLKGKKTIHVILFCLLISTGCLMISSGFSPFYTFHSEPDVNYFITTARCMLRGDTLYQDVYEHKGPYTYFLYSVGLLLNNIYGGINGYAGLFIIEILSFTLYLFFAYKTASLYFNEKIYLYAIIASTGMISSACRSFMRGGQCEEFALPLLMCAIYLCLKYLRLEYPAKIRPLNVITIGGLFALIFWTKYTCTGLFVGLVLFIIILQIHIRKIKQLFIYILQFIVGFSIGSVPMILYFGINHAFTSLFQVYFYNLIFVYGKNYDSSITSRISVILEPDFYSSMLGICILTVIWLVFVISTLRLPDEYSDIRDFFLPREKCAITLMFFFTCLGINFAFLYEYCPEVLYVFSVFGLLVIVSIIDKYSFYLTAVDALCSYVHSFLNNKAYALPALIPAAFAIILPNKEVFLPIALEIAIALICAKLLSYLTTNKTKFIIIYTIMILGTFFTCTLSSYEFLNTVLLLIITVKIMDDIGKYSLATYILRKVPQWAAEYNSNSRLRKILIGVIGIPLALCIYCTNTYTGGEFLKPLEDYIQYQMAEYINKNSDNPVIMYYDIGDMGIYYLTDTYPPERYFGSYNIELAEKDAMYEEYISEKKADYIIAETELDLDGYQLVNGTPFKTTYYAKPKYLYEKIH